MDWDAVIKRNSKALKAIIEVLFALLGLDGADAASRIPRSLHSAALSVLRPAESALRRLIVIAARGLVLKPAPSCPMPVGTFGTGIAYLRTSFQLFDPRKNLPELRQPHVKYAKHPPRILFFGDDSRLEDLWPSPRPAVVPAPPPDGLVNAERLSRRLQALQFALEDLPRQARRMARWRVRREAAKAPRFRSPLRPGPPPGHRKRQIHPIDEVLADCHALAWDALKPDTS